MWSGWITGMNLSVRSWFLKHDRLRKLFLGTVLCAANDCLDQTTTKKCKMLKIFWYQVPHTTYIWICKTQESVHAYGTGACLGNIQRGNWRSGKLWIVPRKYGCNVTHLAMPKIKSDACEGMPCQKRINAGFFDARKRGANFTASTQIDCGKGVRLDVVHLITAV